MCNIIIPLNGRDPVAVFNQAMQLAQNHGSFRDTGNRAGDFEINIPLLRDIKGHLTIHEQSIEIVIVQKPNGISCNNIEQEIINHL